MKKLLIFVLALICPISAAPVNQEPAEGKTTTIRLDVNLVVINVNVFDQRGEAVSGLGQNAFRLFVDDTPRPISVFHGEDAPVAVGLVMDDSASMAPKRSEVIAAALAFARSSNPQDQIFVVHFNDHARFGLPPEKAFTNNISELETALSHFDLAGTTALYDAAGIALSHLARATIEKKVLIIVTDGEDNSSRSLLPDVLRWAQSSGVTFYCIGLFEDPHQESRVLREFAELTGGKAFFPANVKDTKEVSVEIARQIRSQYTLGFSGMEDGKYHRIKVTVEDSRLGELHIRTRPGYFATKP